MDVSQDDIELLAREMQLSPDDLREAFEMLSGAMARSSRTLPAVDLANRSMGTAFARWVADHPIPR